MPIYEFHCKGCERDFKTLRRAEKLNETNCPTCGSEHLMRLLSVTAQAAPATEASPGCGMPACASGGCMSNASFCGRQ